MVIEVNGGTINVSMGSGDTEAFGSMVTFIFNAGTINVEASSAFEADGTAQLNSGDVTIDRKKCKITQFPGG